MIRSSGSSQLIGWELLVKLFMNADGNFLGAETVNFHLFLVKKTLLILISFADLH